VLESLETGSRFWWLALLGQSFPGTRWARALFRSSVGRTAADGVRSAMPLCERLADDAQDGAPVLRDQLEPLPNALPGEINSAEEQARGHVADLIRNRLILDRFERPFGAAGL